ncbi:unnamed protein product [Caenorhabditis bovis]|uniref:Uncharacterized protein n=1 Tax=Caenorhabditis bovis TaxID=2654633 RepID=A0A8S1EYF5_9PELO|nr:unnamed protein product [Caenorhabditis bovis]
MKVFALGLDENQKAEKALADEKKESVIPIETVASNVQPQQPQVVLAKSPKRRIGFTCGLLSWFIGAMCLVLLCLAISEVAYHRQRDQAFLRLKWAELRQRMLGYELLSQQQELDRMALEKQSQIEALPLRRSNDPVKPQIVDVIKPEESKSSEVVDSTNQDEQNSIFGFLQALMDKIRKHAESMGLTGDMQVHVVEVKPIDFKSEPKDDDETQSMERSFADGFGEVAMPHQVFGQQNNEDYFDNGRRTFDRHSMKKPFFGPFNRWENNMYNDYDEQINMPNQFESIDPFNTDGIPQNLVFAPPPPPPQFRPNFFWQQPAQFDNFPQQQPQNWWQPPPQEVMTNQWNQPMEQRQHFFWPQQQQQQQFQQPQPQQFQQNSNFGQNTARPWYMPYEDNSAKAQAAPLWQNDDWMKQQDVFPFQPNPAASEHNGQQWVDETAVQNSETFNNPAIAANNDDSAPPSTAISMDNSPVDPVEKFNVKAWFQPQEEKPAEPVIQPDEDLEEIDESKFLPIRSDDKPSEISNDGVVVDSPSHFFQIDDPSSFKQ